MKSHQPFVRFSREWAQNSVETGHRHARNAGDVAAGLIMRLMVLVGSPTRLEGAGVSGGKSGWPTGWA